jgi:hypothetical protein
MKLITLNKPTAKRNTLTAKRNHHTPKATEKPNHPAHPLKPQHITLFNHSKPANANAMVANSNSKSFPYI